MLEEALTLSPSAEDAVSLEAALGAAYAQSGDVPKAIATLRQFTTEHPDSAEAHLALGAVLAQQEEASADAIAEFREALRIEPNAAAAKLALGHALLEQKNYADALPVLEEYVESQPNDAQGYHFEGLAYGGLEEWDKAGEAFLKAAHLAPADYEIRKDLALALVHAGRTDDAIHEFEAAEKISPKEPEVHQQLAALYEKKGAIASAKAEQAKYAKLAGAGRTDRRSGQTERSSQQNVRIGKCAWRGGGCIAKPWCSSPTMLKCTTTFRSPSSASVMHPAKSLNSGAPFVSIRSSPSPTTSLDCSRSLGAARSKRSANSKPRSKAIRNTRKL